MLQLPTNHTSERWTAVTEYAHGEPPAPLRYKEPNGTNVLLQLQAPIIVNGVRTVGTDLVDIVAVQSATPPPAAIWEQHKYVAVALSLWSTWMPF
jgi:hypothetical protein